MRTRAREPYFPSFTLVLTQAQRGLRAPSCHIPRSLRYHPYSNRPPFPNDPLMMTVDYRNDNLSERFSSTGVEHELAAGESNASPEMDLEVENSLDQKNEFPLAKFWFMVRLKIPCLGMSKG